MPQVARRGLKCARELRGVETGRSCWSGFGRLRDGCGGGDSLVLVYCSRLLASHLCARASERASELMPFAALAAPKVSIYPQTLGGAGACARRPGQYARTRHQDSRRLQRQMLLPAEPCVCVERRRARARSLAAAARGKGEQMKGAGGARATETERHRFRLSAPRRGGTRNGFEAKQLICEIVISCKLQSSSALCVCERAGGRPWAP